MGSKRERAVVAAADLFMRHGFTRTTMGDIAKAADMSRPALYLLFPGKAEVFEATVLHLNALRIAEIRSALLPVAGLAERLFTACDLWLVGVYELQDTTADARDMDDLSFPVVRKVYADLQNLLAELIEEHGTEALPATPQQLARNLVYAVRGLGATATGTEEMREMTRLQVELVCAAIARTPAPSILP